MASGLAYDSDGGRALAGAITSLMTGTSYRRSAELAGIVGAYNGYARNASAHTRVMRKHQNATESAKSVSTLDKDVWTEAVKPNDLPSSYARINESDTRTELFAFWY